MMKYTRKSATMTNNFTNIRRNEIVFRHVYSDQEMFDRKTLKWIISGHCTFNVCYYISPEACFLTLDFFYRMCDKKIFISKFLP
jgi:hypothetical protein